MKKLFKNKQGFTLIELLVVIGILAVLAAIAIPSVAGLIDRANKSADNSNAVEMTNAVERFVSEYELYKQDIASGTFKESDLDSAQGRVFNVTGIKTREDVTKFESTGLNGKGVDLDSKYPANEETVKAVIQNYMKTSSSTYEPKQSDCQYYYSPECGKVVVSTTGSTPTELDAIVFDDALILNTTLDSKAQYDTTIQWICLDTAKTDNTADTNRTDNGTLLTNFDNLNLTGLIPAGATYYVVGETTGYPEIGDYSNAIDTLEGGVDHFPTTSSVGDIFVYGDYEYRYKMSVDIGCWDTSPIMGDGWGVSVRDYSEESYSDILKSINGKPITSLCETFAGCENLTTAPALPDSAIDLTGTFANCYSLITVSKISSSAIYIKNMFIDCENLTGTIRIDANPTSYDYCFGRTTKPIKLIGNASIETKKALCKQNWLYTQNGVHQGVRNNVTYE